MSSSNHSSSAATLSILVISRTADNLSRLLSAIDRNRISISFDVLCSWNGEPGNGEVERIAVPVGMSFRLIEQYPYNFARNNNSLSRLATGKYVLFINDDVIPDPGCINTALKYLHQSSVGITGINLRYPDGRLQHAGVFFQEDGTPFHRLKHNVQWDDHQVASNMFVPSVTGAFIMMRLAEFQQLYFDESFNVCGEDIALNLSYREHFDREILYVAESTAVHVENATRKITNETKTPPEDMLRILEYTRRIKTGVPLTEVSYPRIHIITEKPGWIMHRKAQEIKSHMSMNSVRINEDWPDADIHYYINYGYYNSRPISGITIANFTHYDPDFLADKFVQVARQVDHCIAVSEQTAEVLRNLGIPDSSISTILVGADTAFTPKLVVGIVGRIYPGGRKGEDIVKTLLDDPEIMDKVRIVSSKDGWQTPVWHFEDMADFYRAVDYLLVPSRIEGGPVPFMEALACGTLSVAPEIGVIPQFPHISYPVGDTKALKKTLLDLADQHLLQRKFLTSRMKGLDWHHWAFEHELVFRKLSGRERNLDD